MTWRDLEVTPVMNRLKSLIAETTQVGLLTDEYQAIRKL